MRHSIQCGEMYKYWVEDPICCGKNGSCAQAVEGSLCISLSWTPGGIIRYEVSGRR